MNIPDLHGVRITLGVTGGIAAYKSAELVRLLVKARAEVQVVMTAAATEFITPLTLQALSGNAVKTTLLDEQAERGMGHIELARWTQLLVIAPATADFIATLNAGLAGDLLSTLCLTTQAPIALAPAMNEKMWANPITQANIKTLQARLPLLRLMGPASGEQACGDVGYGRMLEPEEQLQQIVELSSPRQLVNKKIVITAGPTQEPLDPVRFLSNYSSGKMGFALAAACARQGAAVTLISGPVNLPVPAGVDCTRVQSAEQMLQASLDALPKCDVFLAAAAVADYRPVSVASQKIKKAKKANEISLQLVENPDILAQVARHALRPRWVIGFAAETEAIKEGARQKLSQKNIDAIVANDVSRSDVGFAADDNEILFISRTSVAAFGPAPKAQVATFIIQQLLSLEHHATANTPT